MSSTNWRNLTPGFNVPGDTPVPLEQSHSLGVGQSSNSGVGQPHNFNLGQSHSPDLGQPQSSGFGQHQSSGFGQPHSHSPTGFQANQASPLGSSAASKGRSQSDTLKRAALMNATTASLEDLTQAWRRYETEGPSVAEENVQKQSAYQYWQGLVARHARARQNSPMNVPIPGADGVVYPNFSNESGFITNPYNTPAENNDWATNPYNTPVEINDWFNSASTPSQPTTNQSYMEPQPGISPLSPLFIENGDRSRMQMEFDQLCHMRRVSEAAIVDLCHQVNQRLQYVNHLRVQYGQQNAMPQIIPVLGFVTHAHQVIQGHRDIIRTADDAFALMAARGVTLEDMVGFPS